MYWINRKLFKIIITLLMTTSVTSLLFFPLISCANNQANKLSKIDVEKPYGSNFNGTIVEGEQQQIKIIPLNENGEKLSNKNIDITVKDENNNDYIHFEKIGNEWDNIFLISAINNIEQEISIPILITGSDDFLYDNGFINVVPKNQIKTISIATSETQIKQGDSIALDIVYKNFNNEKILEDDLPKDINDTKILIDGETELKKENNQYKIIKSGNVKITAEYNSISSNQIILNVEQDDQPKSWIINQGLNEEEPIFLYYNNKKSESIEINPIIYNQYGDKISGQYTWKVEDGKQDFLKISGNTFTVNDIPSAGDEEIKITCNYHENILPPIDVYVMIVNSSLDYFSIPITNEYFKMTQINESSSWKQYEIYDWSDNAKTLILNEVKAGKKINLDFSKSDDEYLIASSMRFVGKKNDFKDISYSWFYNYVQKIDLSGVKFESGEIHDEFLDDKNITYASGAYTFSGLYQSVDFLNLEELILNNTRFTQCVESNSKSYNVNIMTGYNTFKNDSFPKLKVFNMRNSAFTYTLIEGIQPKYYTSAKIYTGYGTFQGCNFPILEILDMTDTKFALDTMLYIDTSTYNSYLFTAYNTFNSTKFNSLTELILNEVYFSDHHMLEIKYDTIGKKKDVYIKTAYSTFEDSFLPNLLELDLSNAIFASDNPINDKHFTGHFNICNGYSTFFSANIEKVKTVNMYCTWESQTYDWFWGEWSETSLLTNFFYKAKADQLDCIELLSRVGSNDYHANKWIINSSSFDFASLHEDGKLKYSFYNTLPKENIAFFDNLNANYNWLLEEKLIS